MKRLRRDVLWLQVFVYILIAWTALGPWVDGWLTGERGEMHWFGQELALYNKDSADGGFRFCEIGAGERHGVQFQPQGPTMGAGRILLLTELTDPVVELFRDPETGEGRILLYGRNGDVIWQAPEPRPAVDVEAAPHVPTTQ